MPIGNQKSRATKSAKSFYKYLRGSLHRHHLPLVVRQVWVVDNEELAALARYPVVAEQGQQAGPRANPVLKEDRRACAPITLPGVRNRVRGE